MLIGVNGFSPGGGNGGRRVTAEAVTQGEPCPTGCSPGAHRVRKNRAFTGLFKFWKCNSENKLRGILAQLTPGFLDRSRYCGIAI